MGKHKKKKTRPENGQTNSRSAEAESGSSDTSSLTLRFIDMMERQLLAKDEQIRSMDARLQDAFDMQRALALIVREFEKRTGISSDVLWDHIPDDAIQPSAAKPGTRKAKSPARRKRAEPSPRKRTKAPSESVVEENKPVELEQKETTPVPTERKFGEWLGSLPAKD